MTTAAAASRTVAQKIKDSLVASAGDIVFGMEGGTVSIFGLVFGVAASAPGSHAVLRPSCATSHAWRHHSQWWQVTSTRHQLSHSG